MQRSLLSVTSTIRRSARPSWIASGSPPATASASGFDIMPRAFSLLSSSFGASSPSNPASTTSNSLINNTTHTHSTTINITSQQIRQRSSRSTRGLYDGKDVRFGNNVPFSMKKTRRRWNPNVVLKRIYSETLDEMVQFHVTTSALRSIDKAGGLDNYLLKSEHVSTKGEGEGQRIRNRIIQKMKHRESLKKQAMENGESVEDWDKIVLVGKKIKSTSASSSSDN